MMILMFLFWKKWRILNSISEVTAVHDDSDASIFEVWQKNSMLLLIEINILFFDNLMDIHDQWHSISHGDEDAVLDKCILSICLS